MYVCVCVYSGIACESFIFLSKTKKKSIFQSLSGLIRGAQWSDRGEKGGLSEVIEGKKEGSLQSEG